jgi:hypothetical protein
MDVETTIAAWKPADEAGTVVTRNVVTASIGVIASGIAAMTETLRTTSELETARTAKRVRSSEEIVTMITMAEAVRLEETGATTVGFGLTTGAAMSDATVTISGSTRAGGTTTIPAGAYGDGTMTGIEAAGGAMLSPYSASISATRIPGARTSNMSYRGARPAGRDCGPATCYSKSAAGTSTLRAIFDELCDVTIPATGS